MPQKPQRVTVALSGGVDSAVATALLVAIGYEVRGVFMKNYEPLEGVVGVCPWKEDQTAANDVAEHLRIPFETWNFEREYRSAVLDMFFREYAAGRTPNPDAACNREVKFGVFAKRAFEEGSDVIATGHHAQLRRRKDGRVELLRGVDPGKDQSYFLALVEPHRFGRTLFPIGAYTKTDVRSLARRFGLPNAERPDSQGICFVGEVDVRELLAKQLTLTPGPIRTVSGERIGTHDGLPIFTIGQRRGINVGGAGLPYFVVDKDLESNTLVVDRGNSTQRLYHRMLVAEEVNWLAPPPPAPFRCSAQIRYRQPAQTATVEAAGTSVRVRFDEPQRAITPGQIVAFYNGNACLGGGTIAERS